MCFNLCQMTDALHFVRSLSCNHWNMQVEMPSHNRPPNRSNIALSWRVTTPYGSNFWMSECCVSLKISRYLVFFVNSKHIYLDDSISPPVARCDSEFTSIDATCWCVLLLLLNTLLMLWQHLLVLWPCTGVLLRPCDCCVVVTILSQCDQCCHNVTTLAMLLWPLLCCCDVCCVVLTTLVLLWPPVARSVRLFWLQEGYYDHTYSLPVLLKCL